MGICIRVVKTNEARGGDSISAIRRWFSNKVVVQGSLFFLDVERPEMSIDSRQRIRFYLLSYYWAVVVVAVPRSLTQKKRRKILSSWFTSTQYLNSTSDVSTIRRGSTRCIMWYRWYVRQIREKSGKKQQRARNFWYSQSLRYAAPEKQAYRISTNTKLFNV